MHRAKSILARRAPRLYAVTIGSICLLLPSLAAACATCMNDPNRQKTVPILLGFIGIPFVVAGGLALVFRQYFRK